MTLPHPKTLAVTYSRDGYRFTAYAAGSGFDALSSVGTHPHFPGDDAVGAASWDWLKSYLLALHSIDDLGCLYKCGHGDWTLSVLCEV